MNGMKTCFISAIMLVILPAAAISAKAPVKTDETATVVYSLPSTTLSFEVEAVCEHFYAGPYAAYAAKYLGIDVRQKDEVSCRLTGVKMNEYTNATTGQLVNAVTKDWDFELMGKLGIPTGMFGPLHMPKTVVGNLKEEIRERVGFDLEVVLPATHDTGSAVLAVPANDDDFVYLSSGTWSLMGIERKEADCSMESMKAKPTHHSIMD